jgi:hypothetical protein
MSELKTRKNDSSVDEFIGRLSDPDIQCDCQTLIKMMERSTGAPATMWGDSIVGFGKYHYKYASGRSGDWFQVGFSPRKKNLTLYLMYGFDRLEDKLKQLGKHKTGKACLYVKNLDGIDLSILQELIDITVRATALNQQSPKPD